MAELPRHLHGAETLLSKPFLLEGRTKFLTLPGHDIDAMSPAQAQTLLRQAPMLPD